MKREHHIWNEFLINPQYRIRRYFALALLLFLIIQPMYMTAYGEIITISEYLSISFFSLLFYFPLICFSFKILTPKLLLRDKFKIYILFLSGITLIMTVFQLISSYIIEEHFNISHKTFNSGFEYLLFLIVLYFLNGFFLMGFLITILLRIWIVDSQHINRLQKEYLTSELQEIKSKVPPDFLFNMLNKANVLAKINPEKASEILLKLSHILRYQLYDSKRERVMLSSEISFMRDYLYLEKMRSDNFQFSITESQNIQNVSIPALLFVPILECSTRYISMSDSDNIGNIDVEITENVDAFHFKCQVSKLDEVNPFWKEQESLYRRIDLIYNKNSSISISETDIRYTTHITITYEK